MVVVRCRAVKAMFISAGAVFESVASLRTLGAFDYCLWAAFRRV